MNKLRFCYTAGGEYVQFKKTCTCLLAAILLAGCNGNTALSEITTNTETTQAVERSAEAVGNLVPTKQLTLMN